MFQIEQAIQNLAPNNGFSVRNGTDITWFSNNPDPQPSDVDIKKESDRLKAEYDAQAYARNRAAEYPSIAELTVALYDEDDKVAIEAKRAAIKKKWPKDNSGPVE